MDTRILNKNEHAQWVFINPVGLDLSIQQAESSQLTLFLCVANAADAADYRIRIDQLGPNCQTRLFILTYLSGTRQADISTSIHHHIGQSSSEQLIKILADDQAQASFYGLVKIDPHAQLTQAQQTARNMLLSPTAQIRTQPQLEIYADDVKASHGATTGQLDEQALFYMQQRGIARATAKQMLLQAFCNEIIDAIADSELQQQAQQLFSTYL